MSERLAVSMRLSMQACGLPFEIDRKSWVKLPHQVADGIRRCIVDGVWKPSEKLPSARALASELGVSFRVAVEALRILAKEGRSWLPDVLYFSDDFLCYGAMTAMLTHGIRVPEDVHVASLANKGHLRAYRTTLTRVEYDAEAMGDKAADVLLEYLRNGDFTQGCVLSAAYRIGGSFR